MKKIYISAALITGGVFCACGLGQKIFQSKSFISNQSEDVVNTNYGLFLATQHALSVNDFSGASDMIKMVDSDVDIVWQNKNRVAFLSGQMPQDAVKLKSSKDLVDGLIYDSSLILQNDWKNVYVRHNKDATIFAAPLRIFSGIKQGKTKDVIKFINSIKVSDSWKSFLLGQVAVLNNNVDEAARHFAKVHPDFMNVNDYLYLMSFYQENGMVEDMEILRGDFLAKPGGMYILNYPKIPDWSNYKGYKNNLVFAIIQNISHTQIMTYTDLSLIFLRFAQIISNDTNTDAINYYLGEYYFHNSGDWEKCFADISEDSPLYLFGWMKKAEYNNDMKTMKQIVNKNPLFVPAIQKIVRNSIKNGDKNTALSVLNRSLKQKTLHDEGRVYFLKQRAHVYLMFGDAKRAQKDLDEIEDINSELSPEITLLQARAWLLQNVNLDKAYSYAMALIRKNTSDVIAWDLLGQIVDKKEGVDNALEIMERIGAVAVNVSSVYEHLGDFYVKKGEKEKALRAYLHALDLSNDSLVVIPIIKKKIRKIK